jgi:hypothetical protein
VSCCHATEYLGRYTKVVSLLFEEPKNAEPAEEEFFECLEGPGMRMACLCDLKTNSLTAGPLSNQLGLEESKF